MSDTVSRWLDSLVDALPHNRVETIMRREHAKWLQNAELNRPYYTEDSHYEWVGHEWETPRLYCHHRYVFVKRDRHALYTKDGVSSWRAWFSGGDRGLTCPEPPLPLDRPTRFRVAGNIGDDPRKWTVDHYAI